VNWAPPKKASPVNWAPSKKAVPVNWASPKKAVPVNRAPVKLASAIRQFLRLTSRSSAPVRFSRIPGHAGSR